MVCLKCFSVVFRDTPRKRSGAPSGSSAPSRSATAAGSSSAEPQPEEAVDENFPVSKWPGLYLYSALLSP